MTPRILIIDDEQYIRNLLHRALSIEGYLIELAENGVCALAKIQNHPFDIILLDMNLPDMHGLELLRRIKEFNSLIEVIVMTGFGSIEIAVEAIKLGAFHFLTKPLTADEIRQNVRNMIERIDLRNEIHSLRQLLSERNSFHELLGRSLVMRDVFMRIGKIASTDASVLIEGESGTGKELAARAIHAESPRSEKPFIAINCSAISPGTVESELFGHERGSFTGAYREKAGFFREAHGGTLFLDEIGILRPEIQVMLLRVLQEREFHPVGSTRRVKTDIRLISASNVPLAKLVSEGGFREDLYYRLNVVTLNLPPLRERGEDLSLLINHFLMVHGRKLNRNVEGIARDARELLERHRWPGNVRELENLCERAVMMAETPLIQKTDLPDYILDSNRPSYCANTDLEALSAFIGREHNFRKAKQGWNDFFEKQFISQALLETGGHVTQAAREIGMPRTVLQRLMKKHQVRRETFKE